MDLARFGQIEAEYHSLGREMLRNGKLPMRSTSHGFWSPAISSEAFVAFQQLGLEQKRSFLDMGSGDGRVTLIASLFVPKAEGVEIDSELHSTATFFSRKLAIPAVFHLKDFFAYDISGYEAVFLNPDTPLERGMERKLLKELNGELIVQGHHFHPRLLEKIRDVGVNGTPFTVYRRT